MEANEEMPPKCGNCVHWEANGTRFGGRCWSERAQTYGLITSALKTDCPDHTAIRTGEHYALAGERPEPSNLHKTQNAPAHLLTPESDNG